MIELKNLSAGYDGIEKLHSVSLRCKKGEITALIGPNGSGKSTLLKAISALLPRMSGDILFAGQSIAEIPQQKLAQTLAYLPQSRNVPEITVRRMVLHGRFPYLGYPRKYRAEDYAAADAAMMQTDILDKANLHLHTLSGGERQKVYLAMAIAQDTPAVLLDEPTTYLDIEHQLGVLQLMQTLKAAGKTVIVVLHDINLALQCADTVAVLQNGSLVATGAPEAIAESGILDSVFHVHTEICKDKNGTAHYFLRYKKL